MGFNVFSRSRKQFKEFICHQQNNNSVGGLCKQHLKQRKASRNQKTQITAPLEVLVFKKSRQCTQNYKISSQQRLNNAKVNESKLELTFRNSDADICVKNWQHQLTSRNF